MQNVYIQWRYSVMLLIIIEYIFTLYGCNTSGTWGMPQDNSSKGSWDEGEGASCEPGGPGA